MAIRYWKRAVKFNDIGVAKPPFRSIRTNDHISVV